MKKIFIIIITLLLVLVGCKNTNGQETNDELYFIENNSRTFVVNLDYYEGTNYQWFYDVSLDGVIIKTDEKYVPIKKVANTGGTPGKYMVYFEADPELNYDRKVTIRFTYNTFDEEIKHPKTYEFKIYVTYEAEITFENMITRNLNGVDEEEHVWEHIDAKKMTCYEDGHSAYDKCTICGEERGYEFYEKKGGDHNFVYSSDNHSPSKENPIYAEYKCSKCGEITGEYDNALNRSNEDMENLNILLIGNSFTNYNTMMNCLKGVIEGEGINVNIVKVSYGSQYLYDYIEGPDGDYYYKVKEAVEKEHFDIVFLQDQSMNPALNPANFYDSVRTLYEYFNNLGTTCILYETWTRKNGYSSWTAYELAQRLCASYCAIGNELGLRVSHCGTAEYYIQKNYPQIETHNSDGSHPSTYISYVVALCHYATIYGRSPIGINYTYNDYINDASITWHADNVRKEIDDETQRILEQVAYDACFGPSMLENKYVTSSIGITEKK